MGIEIRKGLYAGSIQPEDDYGQDKIKKGLMHFSLSDRVLLGILGGGIPGGGGGVQEYGTGTGWIGAENFESYSIQGNSGEAVFLNLDGGTGWSGAAFVYSYQSGLTGVEDFSNYTTTGVLATGETSLNEGYGWSGAWYVFDFS